MFEGENRRFVVECFLGPMVFVELSSEKMGVLLFVVEVVRARTELEFTASSLVFEREKNSLTSLRDSGVAS